MLRLESQQKIIRLKKTQLRKSHPSRLWSCVFHEGGILNSQPSACDISYAIHSLLIIWRRHHVMSYDAYTCMQQGDFCALTLSLRVILLIQIVFHRSQISTASKLYIGMEMREDHSVVSTCIPPLIFFLRSWIDISQHKPLALKELVPLGNPNSIDYSNTEGDQEK